MTSPYCPDFVYNLEIVIGFKSNKIACRRPSPSNVFARSRTFYLRRKTYSFVFKAASWDASFAVSGHVSFRKRRSLSFLNRDFKRL